MDGLNEPGRAKQNISTYVESNFEQLFILLVLLATLLVNFFISAKLAFLSFYFLPIIASGYYLGRRKAVLGAFLSLLYVFLYAVYAPEAFLEQNTSLDVFIHIGSWGGFLILAGAVVGGLQEKLRARELEAVAVSKKAREDLEATLSIATELSSELQLSPLLHKIIGTVNTPEKFEANRLAMAKRVWAGMESSDSHECRNCHSFEGMNAEKQKPVAAQIHVYAKSEKKTCIECHQGIAHNLPVGWVAPSGSR